MKTEKKEGVVIKRMVVRVGGKDIALTIEEAQQLHDALAELFAKKVVEVVKTERVALPFWYWNYPVIVDNVMPYNRQRDIWYCSNNTSFQAKSNGDLVCTVTG